MSDAMEIDQSSNEQNKFVLQKTLQGHTRGVSSVKFSPDGKWLATACKEM